MSSLPAEKITSIYRPLRDVAWVGEVYDFTNNNFASDVTLDPVTNYKLDIVAEDDLSNVSIPPSRSVEYVKKQLRTGLPAGIASDLDVDVTGVGYIKNDRQAMVPLFIKLEANEELLDENDAIFDVLFPYGLRSSNNFSPRFNVAIGSLALKRLSGQQKLELQHGISDRLPKKLTLSPGFIQWSSRR